MSGAAETRNNEGNYSHQSAIVVGKHRIGVSAQTGDGEDTLRRTGKSRSKLAGAYVRLFRSASSTWCILTMRAQVA